MDDQKPPARRLPNTPMPPHSADESDSEHDVGYERGTLHDTAAQNRHRRQEALLDVTNIVLRVLAWVGCGFLIVMGVVGVWHLAGPPDRHWIEDEDMIRASFLFMGLIIGPFISRIWKSD